MSACMSIGDQCKSPSTVRGMHTASYREAQEERYVIARVWGSSDRTSLTRPSLVRILTPGVRKVSA